MAWAILVFFTVGAFLLAMGLAMTKSPLLALYMGIIILAALFVALLTLVKISVWELRRARALRKSMAEKYQADGEPYPHFGRGICDECQEASEKVYYLRSGRRLCSSCYEKPDENCGR